MKRKSILLVMPIIIALIAVPAVFSLVALLYDVRLFYIEGAITLAVVTAGTICLLRVRYSVHRYFTDVAKSFARAGTNSLASFTVPIMVVNNAGEITWYNDAFRNTVIKGRDIYGDSISHIIDAASQIKLDATQTVKITCDDKKFTCYQYQYDEDRSNQKMIFLLDETDSYNTAKKLEQSRPCVIFIHVDGLDLLLKNALESQKTEIRGAIEKRIEPISNLAGGYFQRLSSNKYVLITDNVGYKKLLEDKFSLLSRVRELDFKERGGTSLSIGVGVGGENLAECVEYADAALDMAHGRGGDQAVIKNRDEFKFFGGVNQAEQLNSHVRTRLIAGTLRKLILGSENVLVMGHAGSDMDCVGAGIALCTAVKAMQKPVRLVVDRSSTLAASLLDYIDRTDTISECIISPDAAKPLITRKTLLIIVDTHRSSFLECEELFRAAPTVVVIDHHRKNVDYIDNSILFYHNPSASSSCEMITELLQYMGGEPITRISAEALLAGIMLDTHSFVMKTTAHTFEALAYLRAHGANPVEVKKLFSDSLDLYTARTRVVSDAEIIDGCAVSVCQDDCSNPRIVSSQAADELLAISGVAASFVIYEYNGAVNISARSLGDVNVQLVMEQLGGGGHSTMAAAQLHSVTPQQAAEQLKAAIDKVKHS